MSIDRPSLPYESEVVSIRGVPREEPTDGELIERVGNGDRDAFEELYRRYTRPVLGLALRRLGDRAAEDAIRSFAAIGVRPRATTRTRPRRGVALHHRPERSSTARGADPTTDGGAGRAIRRPGQTSVRKRRGSPGASIELRGAARARTSVIELAYWGPRRVRSRSSSTSRWARSRRGLERARAARGPARGAQMKERFDELVGPIEDPDERPAAPRPQLALGRPPPEVSPALQAPIPAEPVQRCRGGARRSPCSRRRWPQPRSAPAGSRTSAAATWRP
jgi:hypothetical protein